MTGFLERLQEGLGLDREGMARVMDISTTELLSIEELSRAELSDFDKHHMWHNLDSYVKTRMAGLLMVQEELRMKQDKDRRARVVRTAQAREIRR